MTSAEYVLDLCARIAAHTDIPGTITRTFLSPATHGVHALLRAEMEALDMPVRIDAAGNVRGLYRGESPDAPVLLLGSHIDTVPDAGAYDGILGVAVPIALLRSLEGRRLPFAVEVIAFSEEEGIRFGMPFLGSRAVAGDLDDETLARTDADGVTLAQAIRNFGLDPEQLDNARLTPGTVAFLEVHIEQGPLLESHEVSLGVVEAISGQSRFEFTFRGQANHAGTTPMGLRKDALMAAAEWMLCVEQYPHLLGDAALRATVGTIRALPGAANIIPGEAVLSLDIRHTDDLERARAIRHLREEATRIAESRGCTVSAVETSSNVSTPMDRSLVEMLAGAAVEAGHAALAMPSGAGHDAMILAPHVPAAMLFVRSPGGLSHHPDESVSLDDVQAALEVCLRFFDSLAGVEFGIRTGSHA